MIHLHWYMLLIFASVWVGCGVMIGRSRLRVQLMKHNIQMLEACKSTDDPMHTYDVIAQSQAVLDAVQKTRGHF